MRRKSDHFTARAKREGYPARSVYKLQGIQAKFRVLRAGQHVLDVGAAPGSWSAFALEVVGASGLVLAVDLNPLDVGGSPNLVEVCGDVFAPQVEARIRQSAPFDVVLSDAAPSTTGNRVVDTARSEGLVERVIALAEEMLSPGGALVVKIFQGTNQKPILDKLRSIFNISRAYKPQASRSESFETYFIGLGKRA